MPDVAHVRPYAELGREPIPLRKDLHVLSDAGYVTVTPSLELRVSWRIREAFENGRRDYYALEGYRSGCAAAGAAAIG